MVEVAGKVIGVAHTGITVSDLDRAITFFRDVLGGAVTEPVLYDDPVFEGITGVEEAKIRIAFVDLPGHKLELLQYVSPSDRRASNLRPCDSGHIHLSLLVQNVGALVARLRSSGFNPVGPTQHVGVAGGLDVIYCYGFDGLVIELMDFSAGAEGYRELVGDTQSA